MGEETETAFENARTSDCLGGGVMNPENTQRARLLEAEMKRTSKAAGVAHREYREQKRRYDDAVAKYRKLLEQDPYA